MQFIQDLPIEILRIILKSLDPLSIKNCMLTCNKWKEVIAHYIFQPYLRKLVIDENLKFNLKQKIKRKGWTYDCIDYDLITALYKELRFYKGMLFIFSKIRKFAVQKFNWCFSKVKGHMLIL